MSVDSVALVTAASRGIGAGCARELAARGYRLVLMSRSDTVFQLAEELQGVAVSGSVTNPQDLQQLVNLAINTYGRIDAVVNNTGHPAKGALLELSDQEWHEGLDLLILNVIRMAKLVTPLMQKQGGGAIVNISSFGALEPNLAFPISSALRAALSGFTKLYADQYAADHLRMNNLLPGFIDNYPVSEEVCNTIPMGRSGYVSEVAKTAAFLLSKEASYITGQNIRVDGGLLRSL